MNRMHGCGNGSLAHFDCNGDGEKRIHFKMSHVFHFISFVLLFNVCLYPDIKIKQIKTDAEKRNFPGLIERKSVVACALRPNPRPVGILTYVKIGIGIYGEK